MVTNNGWHFDSEDFDRKRWKQAERIARHKLVLQAKQDWPEKFRNLPAFTIQDLVIETERIFELLENEAEKFKQEELSQREAETISLKSDEHTNTVKKLWLKIQTNLRKPPP